MYILSCYEKFTESDLNDFENLIIDWAKKFIALFNTYSNSELKFPKLHSWVYHTTDLIKKYGSLNGFSTKTYESLHKDFVKKLYYLTNKQNIEDQILKMIYLLLNVETTKESVLNLALIWWYDFKSTNDPYYYRCPRFKKTELYNIIDIEAIKNHVHIIPRFNKSNDYLVNKYIF
ncbi:zn-finger domain-containing protein [Gigaspora margarita]|uniref:Zn-finger domain-containing protein n=1 Tax=Gigaspora margarita TaxID=4874 RepID=A0A8H4A2H4_GIGMA|nr:zn-finger domain-containing protein [Gigaspora margarita]